MRLNLVPGQGWGGRVKEMLFHPLGGVVTGKENTRVLAEEVVSGA